MVTQDPSAVPALPEQPAKEPRPTWRARAISAASEAATNPSSSLARLWLLSFVFANSHAIDRALAGNPATTERLLRRVTHRALRRGHWNVGVIAAGHPACSVRLFRWLLWSSYPAVEVAVATDPRASSMLMERLTEGVPEARLRLHIAANPSAPPEVIDRLLDDRDVYVRRVAAAHPAATPEGLRRLCGDMSQPAWTLRATATNPACPPDLSDQLLTWLALGGAGSSDPHFDPIACTGHPGSTEVHPGAWYANAARQDRAETHPLWRVRAAIPMARPRILISVLKLLALDPRVEVRRQAARFQGLPFAALRELRADTDPAVARLAEGALKNKPKELRKRLRWRGSRRRLAITLVIAVGLVILDTHQFFLPSPVLPAPSIPTVTLDDGVPVAGTIAMTRSVPGGGAVASGTLSGFSDLPNLPFIAVTAGSVALTVTVPGAFSTGQVPVIESGPVVVPAHQRTVVVIPTDPTSVSVTLTASDGTPDTLFFTFNG